MPINVDPLYVWQVIVPDPEAASGIAFIIVNGRVHDLLVPSPEPMLIVWLPNLAVRVCVKALDALGIEIVTGFPISIVDALSVGVVALGIVSSV